MPLPAFLSISAATSHQQGAIKNSILNGGGSTCPQHHLSSSNGEIPRRLAASQLAPLAPHPVQAFGFSCSSSSTTAPLAWRAIRSAAILAVAGRTQGIVATAVDWSGARPGAFRHQQPTSMRSAPPSGQHRAVRPIFLVQTAAGSVTNSTTAGGIIRGGVTGTGDVAVTHRGDLDAGQHGISSRSAHNSRAR